ncbi:MAG: glycoside hydrolase family 2 TIM barrel-domain containing protein [Clostridia bacterium]|nr:glycoside hydrolase family 2 TIM barrel-domain containing protein [Clostridia bacterium]
MKKILSLVLVLAMVMSLTAAFEAAAEEATREEISLSGEWKFIASNTLTGVEGVAYDDSQWESVTVPHSWADYENRPRYSNAWYRRTFTLEEEDVNKELYLTFDGVMSVADVYVNGVHMGKHKGGYTAFNFDITHVARTGENTIAVMASNIENDIRDAIPCIQSLYQQWGGMYRNVRLTKTNKVHVDPTDMASTGVYLSQSNLTDAGVDVAAQVLLKNAGAQEEDVTVNVTYTDPTGAVAAQLSGTQKVAASNAVLYYSPNWDISTYNDALVDDTEFSKSITYYPEESWSFYTSSARSNGGAWIAKPTAEADSCYAEYRFTAPYENTTVVWTATTGPNKGKVKVFIDGELKDTVSLCTSGNRYTYKYEAFRTVVPKGTHTIRLLGIGPDYDVNPSKSTGEFEIDTLVIYDGLVSMSDMNYYVNKYDVMESRNESQNFNTTYSSFGKEYMTITFEGDYIEMYNVKNADCGKLLVEVDGQSETVDLYSASRRRIRTWEYEFGDTGPHTIKVTNLNEKNSLSTASTSNGYNVNVAGFLIANGSEEYEINATNKQFMTLSGHINNPQRWSIEDPNLYDVKVELSVGGVVVDVVEERTGFRTYETTPTSSTLNGKSELLRGAAYHQELEECVSVMTEEKFDMILRGFKDQGMNFVRLAHYPRVKYEYDRCDELGLLVWAENGNTAIQWSGDSASDNFAWYNQRRITREMVRQNFNHPSIVFWSFGNETDKIPVANRELYEVVKQEDSSRYAAYACSMGYTGSQYTFAQMQDTDAIFGFNLYRGWYSGEYYDFPGANSNYISETSAGGVATTHNDYFVTGARTTAMLTDSWEPEEYQQLCVERQLQYTFVTTPDQIPMYTYWTFYEFGDTKYKSHINSKAMITYGGYKKDVYYLWRAYARKDIPVLQVVGKNWFVRENIGNAIKVYSNSSAVTLTVNGVSKGTKDNGVYKHPNNFAINNVFYWDGVLTNGKNTIVATDADGNTDTAVIYFSNSSTGAAAAGDEPIEALDCTNSVNHPVYVDTPLVENQAVYYQSASDNTAKTANCDNTFSKIPSIIQNARLIGTKRMSDGQYNGGMTFKMKENAKVFVLATDSGVAHTWITDAGFEDTGVSEMWRNNSLNHDTYKIYMRECNAGETISLAGELCDYVVLVDSYGNSLSAALGEFAPKVYSINNTYYLPEDGEYSAPLTSIEGEIEVEGTADFVYAAGTLTVKGTRSGIVEVIVTKGADERIITYNFEVFNNADAFVDLICSEFDPLGRYNQKTLDNYLVACDALGGTSISSEIFVTLADNLYKAYKALVKLDDTVTLADGTEVINVPQYASIHTPYDVDGAYNYSLLTDNRAATCPSVSSWMIFDFGEGYGAALSEIWIKAYSADPSVSAGTVLYASQDGETWSALTNAVTNRTDWQVYTPRQSGAFRFLRLSNPSNSAWSGEIGEMRLIGSVEQVLNADSMLFSTYSWTTSALTPVSGVVNFEYDATPFSNNIDGFVGFVGSSNTPSTWDSYNCAVRFNPSGTIDVRNAGAFSAVTSLSYSAGQTYHVRGTINIAARTYTVYVNNTLVASNYTFRTNSPATSNIAKVSLKGGSGAPSWQFRVDNLNVYSSSDYSLTYDSASKTAKLYAPASGRAKLIAAIYSGGVLKAVEVKDVNLSASAATQATFALTEYENGCTLKIMAVSTDGAFEPLTAAIEK